MDHNHSNLPLDVDCHESKSVKLNEESPFEPVAIIGFSIKFPQDVTSEESFWNLLLQRQSTMTEVPQDRWNGDAFYKSSGNKTGTV
jgi:acyl transferase domain-containing protein